MDWVDIASIVFVAVTTNHLGLVSAIEDVIKVRLTVINCPKCLAFWMTLVYGCDTVTTYKGLFTVLAVSFLASYAAIWLELAEGYIDTLYMKLYEKITTADSNNPVASDANSGDSAGSVS